MIKILSYPRTESYTDDYEPGTRDPQLLLQLDTMWAARAAAAKWPFPAAPIPADWRAPPPTRPDPEPAPW